MSTSPPPPSLRAFRGQPRWVLPSLGGVLLVAALLYTWNIGYSGISTYYASAAKSMSESWGALFTGAMDPSATVTLDKLSGFLVPQALAIRLFGFHAWALSLPQVIEGLVTIVAAYAIGTRWRGPVVGMATAGVMTVTPMLAAMFGRPMEDGMLTMTMVLAFAAWQRAMLSGGMGWLLISGAFVAVGFQAKMLQAWLILPALVVGTLVAGRGPLGRRILQVVIVGVATALLSITWMTAIQLIPSGSRPYIDGSTNDNIFSMVFGYNGVDRLLPGLVPGAVPQLGTGSGQSISHAISGTRTADAGHSFVKLLLPEISTQIGWLYPSALAGIVIQMATLLRRRRAFSGPDRFDAGMTMSLVAWIGVTGVILSAAFVPHATYFAVIALPLALFAVVGAVRAIHWYLARAAGLKGLALPTLAAAQTGWQALILITGPEQTRALLPVVAGLGLAGVCVLLASRHRRLRDDLAFVAVVAVVAASLVAPVLWSLAVILPGGGGSASDAYAGPRLDVAAGPAASRAGTAGRSSTISPITPVRPPFQTAGDPELTVQQSTLVDYLEAHNSGRPTLFATDTLAVAVSVILATPNDVLPMGGFSRQAPTIDAAGIRSLVDRQRLRFVLLANPVPSASNPAIVGVRAWVRGACSPVMSGQYRQGAGVRLTLYDCRP